MNKSNYFGEIASAYDAEMDDLTSDSEGKSVLAARLKDKRKEIDALLQMAEFAPEMVIPVFHRAFTFRTPAVMARAALCEPDDDDFALWDDVADSIGIEAWAAPIVEKALAVDGGDRFMVTAAVAEFLRSHGGATAAAAPVETEKKRGDNEDEDDGDGEMGDLGEGGADWLSEQGFDSQPS